MAKNEVGYVHFIPPAKDNSRFPACNTHLLIRSLDILIETLKANEDKKFMAWDTETSSLDPTEGFVVGFSFAFNPNTGYYVPVRHVNGSLNREAMEIFYNFMKKFIKMNFLANVRFDMRFFEYSGFDMSEIPYFDVLQAIWLADTNKKMPSLKWAEKHFLGWNPMTFGEALGDNTNFYYVDPEDAYPYACADAEGTFAMAQVAIKFYKEAKLAGKVDNDSLYPIMKFEDTPSMIDTEYLGQCLESETRRLAELDQKIYQMIGYQIKINSSKQLGDALQSMGINTGKFTAKGQMKVDIKTLESVNVNDEYPLISLIIERSRTFKSINSYISTLKEQAEKNGGKLRFSYLTTQVPSGRLACGSDKKNTYFAHINVQSCLTENNYLYTKRGLLSIKDVVEGDFVWDGDVWRRVEWSGQTGIRRVWRTTLSNGAVLESTDDHPLYSATDKVGFKYVRDLKVGDKVAVNSKCYYSENVTKVTTEDIDRHKGGRERHHVTVDFDNPDFWKVIGYAVGDGSYKEQRGLQLIFSYKETEAVEEIERCLNSCGISYCKSVNKKENYTDLPLITINNVAFYEMMLREFDIGRGSYNKHIPEVVFSLSKDCRRAFLGGMFSSGGSQLRKNTSWSYTTVSERLARELQLLLSSVGLQGSIRHYGEGTSNEFYRVNLIGSKKKQREVIPCFVNPKTGNWNKPGNRYGKKFTIPECLVGRQKELKLGTVIDREDGYNRTIYHKDGMEYYQKTSDYDLSKLWAEIVSIEDTGRTEPVYDITVEGSSRFIANGMLVHNCPKPHPMDWYVHEYHDGDSLCEGDVVILGWRFSTVEKSDKIIEGFSQKVNLRSAFIVKEDEYWLSCDYSGEELRIIANYTNEPNWVNTFLSGGDLHKQMAIAMWGEENYDKEKRKKAKVLNFGMAYGMTGRSLAEKFHISEGEGEDIVARFWKAAPCIKDFQNKCVRRARKEGTVYNYFGRPRRVRFWLSSDEGRQRAFGVRTVNNCYSPDTEFLTSDGWKKAKEIKPDTQIAYYIPDSGECAFTSAGERYTALTREAYEFKSANTDLCVTGNHRMYARVGNEKDYRIVSAQELFTKSGFTTLNAPKITEGDFKEFVRTPIGDINIYDFAEFVGYVATDGTIGYDSRSNYAYVKIFQAKEEVIQRINKLNLRMGSIMHEYVYDYETSKKGTMHSWTISGKDFADFMVEFYGGRLGVDKSLPDWFMKMRSDVLQKTFWAALYGDGSKKSVNSWTFYGSGKKFAEQMQLIAMRLGYRSHIRNQRTRQGADLWRVEITLNKNYSLCDKRANYKKIGYLEEVEFSCFSVPTGLLVVRRNGKISVCGNTIIQSVGADLLKIAMIKLWKRLLHNPDWDGDARFVNTVH